MKIPTPVITLIVGLALAVPPAQAAPKLDLSTLTAQDGDTTLTATPIDGETGSGF